MSTHSFTDLTPRAGRERHAVWRAVAYLAALALSVFHLYTAVFGTLPSHQQRAFHVALGLGLVFLLYPARAPEAARERWTGRVLTVAGLGLLGWLWVSGQAGLYVVAPAAGVLLVVHAARELPWRVGGMPPADLVLAVLACGAGLYLFASSEDVIRNVGRVPATDPSVTPSFVVATVGVLVVLAAAQRAIGSALTVLAGLALVYAYLGPYMPGFLAHSGYTIDRILATSYLGTEGVFGTPIAVSATFIFLFLVFASLLQRTGMERFFTRLALGLAGGYTGGTAKVGVLTSAFSGTITGSSVANTVSNGAFTIPMMRRAGYRREFAGAVEAASSTGGQFAPPIMGAAAFIMLEFTGVPYRQIIAAAAVPAVLYFVAQFVVIHYESKKQGIRGLPRDQLPRVRRLLAVQGYLLAPLVLIFVILASGATPMRAALWAIGATVAVNVLVQAGALVLGAVRGRGTAAAVAQWRALEDRLTPRTLLDGLVDAARLALPIIAACAAAGLIAGVITLTGIGLKLVGGVLDLGQRHLLLVLLLVMLACLVLGIGLPTTANYVITATLAAPALLEFDQVELLAAHMFVYYFGVMADITPPVCLAAYAAAGISGGSPLRTGVWSVRIAASGFLVPYMFVLDPQLLLLDVTWAGAAAVVVTALVGVTSLGVAVAGYLDRPVHWGLRLLLAAAALALLVGEPAGDALGVVTVAGVFGWHWWTARRADRPAGRRGVPSPRPTPAPPPDPQLHAR